MPTLLQETARSGGTVPDLLKQASAILSREMARLAGAPLGAVPNAAPAPVAPLTPNLTGGVAGLGARACPVTGAAVPLPGAQNDRLQQQAHELLAALLGALGAGSGSLGSAGDAQGLAGRVCPVTKATVPVGGFEIEKDRIRRQAHEFIETLLITFSEATGEKGLPAEDKVPMIRGVAPVPAGGDARASLKISNEEASAADVSFYCTNLTADTGYEIPALRVAITPRRATIPPKGEATFEIKVAIPHQSPAGTYSGLIQAMGSKYAKAVLSVDVL